MAIEIEITPEMIQAVKQVIESREAYIFVDADFGIEVEDAEAEKIAEAVMRASYNSL